MKRTRASSSVGVGSGRSDADEAETARRMRAVKREKAIAGDAERLRTVKKEKLSRNNNNNNGGGGVGEDEEAQRIRAEKLGRNNGGERVRRSRNEDEEEVEEDVTDRRVLRSKYMAVKNLINDERDDLTNVNTDKFNSIFNEVQILHQQVRKPREQVVDAEALLGLASSLVTSVKSHSNGSITPLDFISGLIREFSVDIGPLAENQEVSINWRNVGRAVSPVFRAFTGCCTMLGPMDTEFKQRKPITRTKRIRPCGSVRPEEISSNEEEQTDTDKNMMTMFNILRKNKSVRFENLLLNRQSFAQTVENLFALSFLVKDGRAQISVDEAGSHFVSPKNAPAANLVSSKQVTHKHFVLRLDFKDWKLMADMVPKGAELMPHRNPSETIPSSQEQPSTQATEAYPTSPIRKHSRNRGILIQENAVVDESPPDNYNSQENVTAIRMGKRRIF